MAVNKAVNRTSKSHGGMRNAIEYILRDDKVREGYVDITGPYNYEEISWNKVYTSFLLEKEIWGKDSGRMYAHNIISFHKDEPVTPQQCLDIGRQFADRFFPDHQSVIGVHQDRDHLHVHILTNSVSFIDGRKLHQTKHDLEEQKLFTNQLCQELGLSVTEKGMHFDKTCIEPGHVASWEKNKYQMLASDPQKSHVFQCAVAITEAITNCYSKEAFISQMEARGWHVAWADNRKHITFENKDGKKVRDSNISKTFSLDIGKEALTNEFIRQCNIREEQHRDERRKQEQLVLEQYYREINHAARAAAEGAVRSTEEGVCREGQTVTRGQAGRSGDDTVSLIRKVRIDIARSESDEADAGADRKDRDAQRERQAAEAREKTEEGCRENEKICHQEDAGCRSLDICL